MTAAVKAEQEVWGCLAGALAQSGRQGLLLAGLVPTVLVGCEWVLRNLRRCAQ